MMSDQPSDVMREAADWVVQLRSPDRPVHCEQSFADWLRASPLHVREYLRAVEVWEGLAHTEVAAGGTREDLVRAASDSNLIEFRTTVTPPPPSPAAMPTPAAAAILPAMPTPVAHRQGTGLPGFRWRRVGFAIALTTVFALAYIGWQQTAVIKVSTGVGEQHSEVLSDRSIVELNTQSEIRVGFTATERRVELVRGEAFFDVAKDPARPFIVVTDLATAKAVGTRFSVYRAQSGTIVTVAEGRVQVRDKQAAAATGASPPGRPDFVEVIPGTQAEAQPGRPVQMRQADVDRTFAWRERRLVFDGEPLWRVIEEFNRYNSPPLVISDPRLREQRISGVFGANDPESLLEFLVKVDHITVTRGASQTIRIGGDVPQ
jgi:transmembrane sensor